jgi:hypothetical protein
MWPRFEGINSQRMELASHSINVCEWKLMSMGSIRQQDEHALPFRIDPAAGTGEACVAECIGRQTRARGGIFGGSELPRKRTRFIQTNSHVLTK